MQVDHLHVGAGIIGVGDVDRRVEADVDAPAAAAVAPAVGDRDRHECRTGASGDDGGAGSEAGRLAAQVDGDAAAREVAIRQQRRERTRFAHERLDLAEDVLALGQRDDRHAQLFAEVQERAEESVGLESLGDRRHVREL